ncbi:hypothetical protein PSP6_130062 [Paraburkholderia tropica]|nr:hypothetical protein PSP6_130062 [Paraburkholderia tropica]
MTLIQVKSIPPPACYGRNTS